MPDDRPPTEAALVLFSGGQDSTVCLAWALARYGWVETVGLGYGQRHGPDHRLDLRGFGAVAESALTAHRAIEMTERGLPSTFAPGRNLVFFVYAAALGDRRGLPRLVGGMCETDYSGYPDCRRETLDAMQTAL